MIDRVTNCFSRIVAENKEKAAAAKAKKKEATKAVDEITMPVRKRNSKELVLVSKLGIVIIHQCIAGSFSNRRGGRCVILASVLAADNYIVITD